LFATEGTWREAFSRRAMQRWPLRYLAAASVLLVVSLGLFMLSRRAAGALSSPPRVEIVVLTAIVLVAWAWLVRLTFRQRPSVHRQSLAGELRLPESAFAIWLPLIAISLFAISCSFPGGRLFDWITWLIALAAVLLGPKVVYPARRSSPATGRGSAERVLQELTRYRLADGREAVRGTLRAEFALRERSTTLYAAFCPPFERLPQVEAIRLDGPLATVKLAQVLHQGAQIEVRLSGVADCQQSVTVRLSAVEIPIAETAL
jgi:hypothetical protein